MTSVTANVTTYFFVPEMEASLKIIWSLGLFMAKSTFHLLNLKRPLAAEGGWRAPEASVTFPRMQVLLLEDCPWTGTAVELCVTPLI